MTELPNMTRRNFLRLAGVSVVALAAAPMIVTHGFSKSNAMTLDQMVEEILSKGNITWAPVFDTIDKQKLVMHHVIKKLNNDYIADGKKDWEGTSSAWYSRANNMMMFINNNVDDITGLHIVRTCIKDPYTLPFSNVRMPEHKKFFGHVYPLFRSINSCDNIHVPSNDIDPELARKQHLVSLKLKKGVKDNIIAYGLAT